jgi:hypothetical protein
LKGLSLIGDQAAEAFREEAQRVHGDASTHYDDRSEHWQDSEKGQAFYIWVTTLEELADFDPEPVDTVRIAIDLSGGGPVADMEGDPSDALPELPDMPELEE